MLKLERISKFYSANGVVTSGFSKVSLNFEPGEFVAITGESGSGKSTLLNVISGLDSYEEGEMYIYGQPTSGYSTDELEEYRKKYIANIFQTFNLINSYTVYQNIELVLLLNGYRKQDIKPKVMEIIEKVGLTQYVKTKASKLSGGQKQRVAIARALALETPVIVADEPTGNLDSESAKSIIGLLNELSKDKLIIIVTHNYDQVEEFVTRKITMHDGKIVEDKTLRPRNVSEIEQEDVDSVKLDVKPSEPIKEASNDESLSVSKTGKLSSKNVVRLGVRNTFNIVPKFILLLFVFIFLCMGIFGAYSTYSQMKTLNYSMGYSEFFRGTTPDRILVQKSDKSLFTEADIEKLAAMPNVKDVVEKDIMLDTQVDISSDDAYMSLQVSEMKGREDNIKAGRMPQNAAEGFLVIEKGSYADHMMEDGIIGKTFRLSNRGYAVQDITITGYGYMSKQEKEKLRTTSYYYDGFLVMNPEGTNLLLQTETSHSCAHEYYVGGKIISGVSHPLTASDRVPEGYVYIPEELGYQVYPYGNALWKSFDIKTKNIYFEETKSFSVAAMYNTQNMQKLLGINSDEVWGQIFMNPKDMGSLYDKGNFQVSVLMGKIMKSEETIKAIEDEGYKCLYINKAASATNKFGIMMNNALRFAVMAAMMIFMFFITYFVIKLIYKSRNVYFSTVRMLGASRGNCRGILTADMFVVFNIAFAISGAVLYMAKASIISLPDFIANLTLYLEPVNYVVLYAVLCVMTLLLAGRYAKAMFKKTAMNAYKEEV